MNTYLRVFGVFFEEIEDKKGTKYQQLLVYNQKIVFLFCTGYVCLEKYGHAIKGFLDYLSSVILYHDYIHECLCF